MKDDGAGRVLGMDDGAGRVMGSRWTTAREGSRWTTRRKDGEGKVREEGQTTVPVSARLTLERL